MRRGRLWSVGWGRRAGWRLQIHAMSRCQAKYEYCRQLSPPGADTAKSMVQQKGAMVAATPISAGFLGAGHGFALAETGFLTAESREAALRDLEHTRYAPTTTRSRAAWL